MTVLTGYSSERTPSAEHLSRLGLSFLEPFAETMRQQMLFMDGAGHARLRALCSFAFSPRKVEELRQAIQSVAEDLLDRVIPAGAMDILADLAIPLPAIMTAKLMGLPEEDHPQLGVWVNDIAELHGNFQHHPDRIVEILRSLQEMKTYLAARMLALRDRPNQGLIYSLMTAEIDGQRLTEEEVIASALVMIIGGHETTTNLIASGFFTLLRNPEALEQLRRRPQIVASAVEELLRYESPVQHTARIAPDDTQLGGKSLRKGAKVVAVLAAANRDPSRFPDPDRLDLLRPDNRHLAFGWGAHFCFGAAMARTEAQIALSTLARRLANPVISGSPLQWRQNAGLRGLISLPISFESQAALA
jgi:cytochrome P450